MRIISLPPPSAVPMPSCVVALGLFDGHHLGHRAVLAAACRRARELSLPFLVFTFTAATAPKGGALLLSSDGERAAAFAEAGADGAVFADFPSVATQTPEEFVRDTLTARLGARVAVSGESFRFGHRALGDAAALSRLMEAEGGYALAVAPVMHGGAPISSTRIRASLLAGDCASAAALLGRPYAITLPVVRGDGRGSGLGFPTANQLPPPARQLPACGVYCTRVTLPDGTEHRGVTDVGLRPTVGGDEVRLETHIPDFCGSLYGADLTVAFLGRLRGEQKFPSLWALSAQIKKDCEEAKAWR